MTDKKDTVTFLHPVGPTTYHAKVERTTGETQSVFISPLSDGENVQPNTEVMYLESKGNGTYQATTLYKSKSYSTPQYRANYDAVFKNTALN
jgi:hypothetical protein